MKLRVDPERSRLRIEARATLHAVKAQGPVTGTAELDRADPLSSLALDLEVQLASVRSGDFLQDAKAKSHVEADRHPTARFVLEHASGTLGALVLEGRIEWRGKRTPVRATGQATVDERGARGTAAFDLDMRSFGLTAPKLLFLKVSDVVHVQVELVATPE